MIAKTIKFIGILFLCSIVLAGCSTPKKSTSSNETIKVQSAAGEVSVPKNPKKVVVFDMGSLDTIKNLGKSEVVIGSPIKSLPKYLTSFKDVESVGAMKEPDLEKINQLQPDLIIISGRQEDSKEDLEKIAPVLYLSVDSKRTWDSTKENIQTLASIFGVEETANQKIVELEKDISELNEKTKASQLKTLVTLVNEGSLSAFGHESRFGIIHNTFGFSEADRSLEASTHGQSISYEYVLETDPDVIFVVDRTKAIGGDLSKNNVSENELVKETQAGKNNKIISLTPDVWYLSGGGLESTKLMIQDVKKAFK